MSTGKVKWFDPNTGDARIVGRSGREYGVRAADLEPAARAPRARVSFDVVREGGVARAVNVRLFEGTRTSRLQGRFGNLAGARRPDAAGHEASSREHPDREAGPAPRLPAAVARAWLEAMAEGDLRAALHLYAPDAVVHLTDGDQAGYRAVQRFLEGSVLLDVRHPDIEVEERDSLVHVRWQLSNVDAARTPLADRRTTTRLRVEHGQIVEQWA
jgi:cold shock CspA family protein